jgi:hypothetical protein
MQVIAAPVAADPTGSDAHVAAIRRGAERLRRDRGRRLEGLRAGEDKVRAHGGRELARVDEAALGPVADDEAAAVVEMGVEVPPFERAVPGGLAQAVLPRRNGGAEALTA